MNAVGADGGGRRVAPPEDQRCIWMSAGILSYQRCERNLECEHCPLDAALRAQFGRPGEVGGKVAAGPEVEPLREDCMYARGFCWVKPCADSQAGAFVVRVGLEPGLASVLPAVHALVMPRSGDRVRAGQPHVWAIVEGGTFTLASPLDGQVRWVNPVLADRPHLAAASPFDEGWLYELEVSVQSPDLAGLLKVGAARREYDLTAARFRSALARALRNATGNEPVLADGGAPLRSVPEMVGAERYLELLAEAYAARGAK